MYCKIVQIWALIVCSLTLIDSNKIVELGLHKRRFTSMIYGNQLICIQPNQKAIQKAWSTAYIEIKSEKSTCIIHEGVNVTDLKNTRKRQLSIFDAVINKFQKFQYSNYDKCQHMFYVPLYKHYCFDIEMDGDVQVEYVFTYIDYKLVFLCLLGIFLYYSSKKLSNFHAFHYLSGVSFGVIGFLMILLFILSRFIPGRKIAAITFLTGSSIYLFLSKWIVHNFWSLTESYHSLIFGYLCLSVLISLAYCYYKGPITNPRLINIIEWIIKLVSIVFIYCGSSYTEISISLIVGFVGANFLYKFKDVNMFKINQLKPRFLEKMFPKKRKLLSQEEYNTEAHEYTLKALQNLKAYCNSPDCDQWKIVSRIKSPEKLAKFITEDVHLSDEELFEYEKYSISRDLIDNENNSDEDDSVELILKESGDDSNEF